jgi:hypothetical protein
VAAHTIVAMILEAQNKFRKRHALQQILEIDANASSRRITWPAYVDKAKRSTSRCSLRSEQNTACPMTQVNDTLGWIYYKKKLEQAIAALRKASCATRACLCISPSRHGAYLPATGPKRAHRS